MTTNSDDLHLMRRLELLNEEEDRTGQVLVQILPLSESDQRYEFKRRQRKEERAAAKRKARERAERERIG